MINWGKLKEQGRVKEVGIPWSEEESNAIYQLKIPASYVRKGILTLEEYEKSREGGAVKERKKEEVMAEAKALGIEFVPETDADVLEREIAIKKEKDKEIEKQKKEEKIESAENKPSKVKAKTTKKAVKAKK